MKLLTLILILALGGWSDPPADLSTSEANVMTLQFHEDSQMTIYGSSNVRDWDMDVQTIDGQVVVESADDGTPSVDRIQLEVPVEDMTSNRGSQTDKAHKALKKDSYPKIFFRSDDIEVTGSDGETFEVLARGELIIAGARRDVEVRAEGTQREDGMYRFEGEHEIRLSDFDIDRPTAMMGALRVSDEVTIAFDAVVASE